MSSISASFIKQAAIEMKKEMRLMCSDKLDSCLHDSEEGILFFKWDHLFQEFSQTMPKCVQMFLLLIPGTNDERKIMLLCVILSMLLKKRYPKMALMQRAISILLYGNGCSKQVLF